MWWFEESNQQYFEFYMYWDEYHMSDDYGHDDYNEHCEDRTVQGTCADFEMLSEDYCEWTIVYNSCPEREIMTCASFSQDEYGNMQMYDCMEDFLNRDFWHEFRNEEWWTRPENSEHMDLWMWFDMYHMSNDYDHDDYWYDDYENCEWKSVQLQCTDFDLGMEDYDYDGSNCDILIEYNPCVTDYFVCQEWDHHNDYS